MMPFRRLGRPGLLGTIARTAVVAGTAQMTSNAINRNSQKRAMEEQAAIAARQNAAQQNAAPAPAAPPPRAARSAQPGGDDLVARLETLARLRETGALSEEEFQAAKGQLLQG